MFFRKLRRQQDKPSANSSPSPPTTKRTITATPWNRLYFGFRDPSIPPESKSKKKKNLILTPQDMEMIDYCHAVLIEKKEEEIRTLTKLNKNLARDCRQKNQEMIALKQKYLSLRRENKELFRQLAEVEYCEREWEIEKKQLMQEFNQVCGTSDKQQVTEKYCSETESESILEDDDENVHDLESGGLQGSRFSTSMSMRMSVRDLIQDIEDDIEKHKEHS